MTFYNSHAFFKKKWAIGLFIGALFISCHVQALENNSRSALIIGISHYNGPADDLMGVPADIEMAKEIAKAMDIPDKNITVMRDQEATKQNVLNTLKAFSQKAADGGRVFIYFSGHGTRYFSPFNNSCVEGLLTYDYESISNAEMAQATKPLNGSVDKSILMVDTCHSGGVLNASKTRSVANSTLVAKFASKDKSGQDVCTPVNYKTRSIFDETKTLGALQENVVFISSARPDEVSWDQPGLGGVATQALKECLLGKASDLDSSGAVSLEEVRQCAQTIMDKKVPGPIQVASHVTIRGNRNLIPINSTQSTPDLLPVSNKPITPVATIKPPVKPIEPPVQTLSNNQENTSNQVQPTKPIQENSITQIDKPITKPDVVEVEVLNNVGSLAALKDVESQANPLRKVDIKVAKKNLKIGQDYLDLQIKSNSDGYLYLVLLGSDQKSFYLLYPNKLDEKNFIKANQAVNIPNKTWQIRAAGPVGVDNLLVLVSDSPRDLSKLGMFGSDSSSPFVYSLNDLNGRSALIKYLVGKNNEGASEKFSAKLLSINEVK